MQNDNSGAPQNKKERPSLKRYLVLLVLFLAELSVMYVIQNVYGCQSAKTALVGVCTLAVSLAMFFVAVNLCMRKK